MSDDNDIHANLGLSFKVSETLALFLPNFK